MDKNLKKYQVEPSDIPLMDYTNIFVGNITFNDRGIDESMATFDLVVRDLPPKWSYYIMDGLERFISILLSYKFDGDAIRILKEMKLLPNNKLEKFYRNFKFTGDVYAMPEGTIFFPGEPIVRITAPLREANLITALALNSFCYPIRILTKGQRIKHVSGDAECMLTGVRLPGFEQNSFVIKTSYLLDGMPNVSPFFARKFRRKPADHFVANVNHAVIKSFTNEKDAYKYAIHKLLPFVNLNVMVDTYNFVKGTKMFIKELANISEKDRARIYLTIDSGNLFQRAKYQRKLLDKAGYQNVKIAIMGNLDEFKIAEYVKRKIPIGMFVAVTEFVNITDAPKLEAVYKMAELRHRNGVVEQKAKLAAGKISYPGRKQIFRIYKDNKLISSVIGLENEKLGKPMLHKIVSKGKLIKKLPTLDETKKYLRLQLLSLSEKYKDVNKKVEFPVKISKKLSKMLGDIKKEQKSGKA